MKSKRIDSLHNVMIAHISHRQTATSTTCLEIEIIENRNVLSKNECF